MVDGSDSEAMLEEIRQLDRASGRAPAARIEEVVEPSFPVIEDNVFM